MMKRIAAAMILTTYLVMMLAIAAVYLLGFPFSTIALGMTVVAAIDSSILVYGKCHARKRPIAIEE